MKKKHRHAVKIALHKLENIRIGTYRNDGYRISGVDVIMLGHAQTILEKVLDEPRRRDSAAGVDSPVSIRRRLASGTSDRETN